MPMNEATSQDQDLFVIPVSVDVLRIDSVLCFDLYLYKRPARAGAEGDYVLYRGQNLPLMQRHIDRLSESGIRTVFVKGDQRKEYTRYIESNLDTILADENVETLEKASLVYEAASGIVEDLSRNPEDPAIVERSRSLVSNMIDILQTTKSFIRAVLSVLSCATGIYNHSVNVTLYSLALANHLGMDIDGVTDLGLAALFHDIGKTRVDKSILEKPGKLTDEEMHLVRMHPEWGLQIVKGPPGLPDAIRRVVHEHHERCDGKGYPQGLVKDEIHPFARIVAIINIFDALTTTRPYRPAFSFFDALRIMRDEMDGAIEHEMWRQFVLMLGEEVE